MIDARFLV